MNKKYEFTDETIMLGDHVLHRIKAVRDFGTVTAGELGGFIESYDNLSHEGSAWVFDNATVCENAKVYENAKVRDYAVVSKYAEVYGNAEVSSKALVSDKARVHDDARVFGCSQVFGCANVYDHAVICDSTSVYGNAKVCDNAVICDHATIYNNTTVHGNARVSGNAQVLDRAVICDQAIVSDHTLVCDRATVCGRAKVLDRAVICGDAYVSNDAQICGSADCVTNISYDLEESIRVQTGLIPFNGEVIAYKQVYKDLTSFYDPSFKYEIGKIAEAENPDESNESCASGLHFSNANYWNNNWNNREKVLYVTFLIAKIKLEDIITVQDGKIRCRRAEIIGKYDIKR